MIEDLLSKEERIRLEALNQANLHNAMKRETINNLLSDADVIAKYITSGLEKKERIVAVDIDGGIQQ